MKTNHTPEPWVLIKESPDLLPCPFCGGPVKLERASDTYEYHHGHRKWWGVVCRNTINVGGSCGMEQVPSASIEAAVDRWNMRNGTRATDQA